MFIAVKPVHLIALTSFCIRYTKLSQVNNQRKVSTTKPIFTAPLTTHRSFNLTARYRTKLQLSALAPLKWLFDLTYKFALFVLLIR
jgi:hypothetical protein